MVPLATRRSDWSVMKEMAEIFIRVQAFSSLIIMIIIVIRNSYIAPNPTRLAQSTSDIRINT